MAEYVHFSSYQYGLMIFGVSAGIEIFADLDIVDIRNQTFLASCLFPNYSATAFRYLVTRLIAKLAAGFRAMRSEKSIFLTAPNAMISIEIMYSFV